MITATFQEDKIAILCKMEEESLEVSRNEALSNQGAGFTCPDRVSHFIIVSTFYNATSPIENGDVLELA